MSIRLPRVVPAVLATAALLGSISILGAESADAQPTVDSRKLGMFVGFNERGRFESIEKSLGQPLQWTVVMFGTKSVEQMRAASWGQLEGPDAYLPQLSNRINLVATVPVSFGPGGMAKSEAGRETIGKNLRATASGKWDDDFRIVANRLVKAGYGDAVIRLGHEFDIAHPPFSVQGGNEDAYIAAFRHVHDVFSSVSPNFKFDWTSTRAKFREYGPRAYPGDKYVDIVGMDIYYRKSSEMSDDVWNKQFLARLEEHRDFAKAHGKPVSYPEWGRSFGTTPRFVDLMHGWLAQIDHGGPGGLMYHSYFNERKVGYDLEKQPKVKQRWLDRFGKDGSAPPPPPAPPATLPPITTTPPNTTNPPTTTTPPADPPASPPADGLSEDAFTAEGSRFKASIAATRSGSFVNVVAEHKLARLYNVRHREVGAKRWVWDGQTRANLTVLGNVDPLRSHEIQVKAYISGSWRDWNTVRIDPLTAAASGDIVEVGKPEFQPKVRLTRADDVITVQHVHDRAKLYNLRYRTVGAERWRWMSQTKAETTLIAPTDPALAYEVEVKAYVDGSWRDWLRVRID